MIKKITIALLITATSLSITAYGADIDLDKVRTDLAQLNHEWAENGWNNSVFGEESDLVALMEKYDYLTGNKELVDFVKAEFDREADPVKKQQLRMLYWDLSLTYLFDETAYIYDDLNNHEASDHIWLSFRDEPLPLRDYYSFMREEDDSEKRKEVYYGDINYITNTINPIHRERMSKEKALYQSIGYESATDYYYNVQNIDREKHRALAYDFLDNSNDMFRGVLTYRCNLALGMGPAEVAPWDRSKLYYAKEFDKYFPKEDFLAFTFDFFKKLGFDIENNENILVDYEERPEKEPRAATYTVSVPDDIRVNLKPAGGMDDYKTAFHEFGHALHYAYTNADLPYEFRHLGINAVTETYAFLLERMFLNRNFLVEECEMPEAEVNEYLNHTLFTEMSGSNYYAMLVIYEEKIHENVMSDEEMIKFYGDLRNEYSIWPRGPYNDEAGYLTVDEEFYSIDYMTAWYAEAQLRNKLEELYGERWYKDPAAGEMLKDLFVQGDSITVDQMLQQIGYEQGLDAKYLIDDFEEMYDRFKATSGG